MSNVHHRTKRGDTASGRNNPNLWTDDRRDRARDAVRKGALEMFTRADPKIRQELLKKCKLSAREVRDAQAWIQATVDNRIEVPKPQMLFGAMRRKAESVYKTSPLSLTRELESEYRRPDGRTQRTLIDAARRAKCDPRLAIGFWLACWRNTVSETELCDIKCRAEIDIANQRRRSSRGARPRV